jgi:hypothetical protein
LPPGNNSIGLSGIGLRQLYSPSLNVPNISLASKGFMKPSMLQYTGSDVELFVANLNLKSNTPPGINVDSINLGELNE